MAYYDGSSLRHGTRESAVHCTSTVQLPACFCRMVSPKQLGADRQAAQRAFADRGLDKQNPTVLGQAMKENKGGK